jgi:CBS domain-containing protein
MKVCDIAKERPLRTISPNDTVKDAIAVLCKHNIGALPVCDGDHELVGIITERDVLRLCVGSDTEAALQQKVAAVMTRNLIICVPDDSIENAMHVMTEKRIRHLPIIRGRKLVGILSIGDLVKAKLDESDAEIRFLRDYVAGGTG